MLAAATTEEPASGSANKLRRWRGRAGRSIWARSSADGGAGAFDLQQHLRALPRTERRAGGARINLRLLQHRYGETMDEVFIYTVTHGRPSKGMPNWSGMLSDDDFVKIRAFLHSVQQSE